MPGKDIVQLWDVAVHAEPLRWEKVAKKKRLQDILELIPYFYGGKPRFRLTLTAMKDIPHQRSAAWTPCFQNGNRTGDVLTIRTMNKGDSITVDVGDKLLGYTGDCTLAVGMIPSDPTATVYAFRIVAWEDLILRTFLGTLPVVIGILIGKFVL